MRVRAARCHGARVHLHLRRQPFVRWPNRQHARLPSKARLCPAAALDSDDILKFEFGKPAAPQEIWEQFERDARQAFLAEVAKSDEECDIVIAALQAAAEDDAVSSRSTVPLPVAAYSKRLDVMVAEVAKVIDERALTQPSQQLAAACDYLFSTRGYTVASGVLETWSPYRVYMHNVLAQKCGVPPALAVLLWGLIQRLQRHGMLCCDVQVGLLPTAALPVARIKDDASPSGILELARWVTPKEALRDSLEVLKRAYWPWMWNESKESCFDAPAHAFLGEYGRAGTTNATVGVLQPSGRPFGDLQRALRATERLAIMKGGMQRSGAAEQRDVAVLLCHLGKHAAALQLLEQYEEWRQQHSVPQSVDQSMQPPRITSSQPRGSGDELQLVHALLCKLRQCELEVAWRAQ